MSDAKCFWVTGLPGAGKSTLATKMRAALVGRHVQPVCLDGDSLREVLGPLGQSYDLASRQQLASTYSRLCKMLVEQGHTVICATVSMFHSVREWNRANIPGYVEIFIDTHIELLRQRDQKGLYSESSGELPGVSQQAELPIDPDYRVEHDDLEKIVSQIIAKEYGLGEMSIGSGVNNADS